MQPLLKRFVHKEALAVCAHLGEYFETLSEISYRGRVMSFEPVEANHAVLARKANGEKRWRFRKLALGSEPGIKEINIYQGRVFRR
jgi:hypothetical protein